MRLSVSVSKVNLYWKNMGVYKLQQPFSIIPIYFDAAYRWTARGIKRNSKHITQIKTYLALVFRQNKFSLKRIQIIGTQLGRRCDSSVYRQYKKVAVFASHSVILCMISKFTFSSVHLIIKSWYTIISHCLFKDLASLNCILLLRASPMAD